MRADKKSDPSRSHQSPRHQRRRIHPEHPFERARQMRRVCKTRRVCGFSPRLASHRELDRHVQSHPEHVGPKTRPSLRDEEMAEPPR